jgi:hypothetical protein
MSSVVVLIFIVLRGVAFLDVLVIDLVRDVDVLLFFICFTVKTVK